MLRFLGCDSNPAPPTKFDLGPVANYPPGSRTLLADIPALLIRTADGFSALSLVFTLLGCTVDVAGDGFTCPCTACDTLEELERVGG